MWPTLVRASVLANTILGFLPRNRVQYRNAAKKVKVPLPPINERLDLEKKRFRIAALMVVVAAYAEKEYRSQRREYNTSRLDPV